MGYLNDQLGFTGSCTGIRFASALAQADSLPACAVLRSERRRQPMGSYASFRIALLFAAGPLPRLLDWVPILVGIF